MCRATEGPRGGVGVGGAFCPGASERANVTIGEQCRPGKTGPAGMLIFTLLFNVKEATSQRKRKREGYICMCVCRIVMLGKVETKFGSF